MDTSLSGVGHASNEGQELFVRAYRQLFLPSFRRRLPSKIAGMMVRRPSDIDGIVALCNLAHLH